MESERLKIRRFKTEDESGFIELIRDKMSSKYAAYDEQYPTDEESIINILKYFVKTDGFYAIIKKDSQQLIGYIALNIVDERTRNIGFCLHTRYQGVGYATEAVSIMIEYAKQLGISTLISGTALENKPSVNLLKRLHFTETGKRTGNFTNDKEGNPIIFNGCEYELKI